MTDFKEFYAQWKDAIRVTTSPDLTRGMYFTTERDEEGFDLLSNFIANHGEDWAVLVAAEFESRSALAGRLDADALAKFRMIFDRHMLNLSKAEFGEDYHMSSDERALFLIAQKVPPVRICSALSAAKNATIDMVIAKANGHAGAEETALISAMTTLFMIELNHIMRVYIYYAEQVPESKRIFEVVMPRDATVDFNYAPPTSNGQMSYPDKSRYGMVDLF